jgi:thiamine biosynthesis lipoprotein
VQKTWAKIVALLLVVVAVLSGCRRAPIEVRRTEFLMDTAITITAYGPRAKKAVPAAFAEMRRVADLMNANDPASEVSLINKNAGQRPVKVSPETFELLQLSVYYSELSAGAFDVTVRPLVELWGIGKKGDWIPSEEEIHQALQLVDYRKLVLNDQEQTAFLPEKGMGIDLGGAAKGYATDRARSVLQDYGVRSALIAAGGNIFTLGLRPDGQKWRIGIRHPRPESGSEILAVIPNQDLTLVTSGDYERYFIKDDVRYHHIFDPRTGWPARDLISATIVNQSSAEADILSTAVFVLGPEKGRALAVEAGVIQVVMMTPDFQIITAGDLPEMELVNGGHGR